MQLQTARLSMRPFEFTDFDDLCALYGDPEVMRFMHSTRTPAETKERLTLMINQWPLFRYGMWALHDLASGRFVGRCGLQPMGGGEVELGYTLHREFWGRGLATEASREALRFGFEERERERILAIALPENIASQNVMRKVGMTYQKTALGPYHNAIVAWYCLTREEYLSQKSSRQET